MEYSLVYLLARLASSVIGFWKHWYVDGLIYAWDKLRGTIYSLDRSFAVRITLKHFFEPLWGDYSIIGRIIGPFIRIARIAFGGVLYLLAACLWAILVLVWLFIPIALLISIINF
jgi:VIT1/CCC1 family predicted Fe2+/Mn2+ transporter